MNFSFSLLYSVGQAHDAPYVPHFHSKFLIEEYLKQSSVKYYTILRPFSFMENLFFATRHEREKIYFWTDPQTVVQHIACEDIGKFAGERSSSFHFSKTL
jgi:uncharacterized protein YbjT (DUF2867 family)